MEKELLEKLRDKLRASRDWCRDKASRTEDDRLSREYETKAAVYSDLAYMIQETLDEAVSGS